MDTNDLFDLIIPIQEEDVKNEISEDLFWEGAYGEGDCAGL